MTTTTDNDNSTNVYLIKALPNFIITIDEVLNALQSLKSNKSPRPDNVYPILLQVKYSPLKTVFNMPLQQDNWKRLT